MPDAEEGAVLVPVGLALEAGPSQGGLVGRQGRTLPEVVGEDLA